MNVIVCSYGMKTTRPLIESNSSCFWIRNDQVSIQNEKIRLYSIFRKRNFFYKGSDTAALLLHLEKRFTEMGINLQNIQQAYALKSTADNKCEEVFAATT